jgi:hypothetical protein
MTGHEHRYITTGQPPAVAIRCERGARGVEQLGVFTTRSGMGR